MLCTLRSETRLLGRTWPRLFLLGTPFVLEGEVRNVGSTPVPRVPAVGYDPTMALRIRWADGRETGFTLPIKGQFKPGEAIAVGPFRESVVAAGFFHIDLHYPFEEPHLAPDGNVMGGLSGSDSVRVLERVAQDMVAVRTRWLLWIAASTLVVAILGLALTIRGR